MPHSTIDATVLSDRGNRYGPTAARTPGPQTRPDWTTIDAHAHVVVPAAAKFANPLVDASTLPIAKFSTDASRRINGNQVEDRRHAMSDVEDRIAVLDAMRLDMQVVACPPGQCYPTLRGADAAQAATLVNDGIAGYVGQRPDRLIGLGSVPFTEPDLAAAELKAVMDRGLKGVMILTSYGDEEISDPRFKPFWQAAQALGAVVMLHPNGFSGGERFSKYYFSNVIGNPLDTAVALHHMIFSGLLERLPDLKIFAVHGGGFLPAYAGRIDHAWGAREDCNAGLPHPPSSYLRKIWIDQVVFTYEQLEYLVQVYGADKVLMGTDYPFDMADYDPVGHVMGSKLDEDAKRIVCGGAARALFGL